MKTHKKMKVILEMRKNGVLTKKMFRKVTRQKNPVKRMMVRKIGALLVVKMVTTKRNKNKSKKMLKKKLKKKP